MPTAAESAFGRELVEEVSVASDAIGAEVEESRGDIAVAGVAEGVGDEGTIARPHVGITVAREGPDVAVGGGDDRAVVVYLRTDDEEATLVEVDQIGREVAVVRVLGVDPKMPIVVRSRQ